ncbi:MAG TPA: FAD-dependent oxidoreductase [Flavisolibacter sp.]|nr:FAD-dependent oxidoreductase [Flavisolibacter sp.]
MMSIWEKEAFFEQQDVVIIGSGFAGLWSAYYLKKRRPKLKITILEKELVPSGASTRNAGFACFGSLTELMYDIECMGVDKTLALVEMRHTGLRRVKKIFGRDIDFDLCGGYELFLDDGDEGSKDLTENAAYLNALLKPITGSRATFRVDNEHIAPFGFGQTTHMVKNEIEGYLHSGKLLKSLLQKVQGMGVQVFYGVQVNGFEEKKDKVNISSTGSPGFSASRVLVCTNALAPQLLPDADIVPARGQVLLTSPIENLPFKGAFHSDTGFYYFRNLGNRVLLGGARNKAFDEERTSEVVTSPFIQEELERYLAEVILPHANGSYTIEHRWSGIMGMGAEKTPVVKEVSPGIFCAIGLGGMGVAAAPVLGKRAANLLLS